jgi:hypothetical protein
MFDSKLLETIRVMTNAEVAAFKDSCYLHDSRNRKEIALLFDWITQDHPQCQRAQLSKEEVHCYLFGNKPFSESRINHVMTALLRLLETYLIGVSLKINDEATQLLALAKCYQERNLPSRFEASVSRLSEILDSVAFEDTDQFWQRYQLENLKYLQQAFHQQRSSDLNLNIVLHKLDRYYIAQRLVLSTGLHSLNQFVQIDKSRNSVIYELMAQKEVFAAFIQTDPLIRVYYELLPLLNNEADLDYMISFRALINENRNTLSKSHIKSLYTTTRNYLAIKYNQGHSEMLPLLFSTLKDEYDQGFLSESNGHILASTFQNVVTTALKLKHFEWVRKFMDNYKNMITGTSEPETIWVFNEANYHFHIGNYEAAFDTGFNLLKYESFVYSLAARRLEVKIWYEKKDLNMAEYRLNALKSYLFSNKLTIPELMKRNNDDFVDIVRQLLSPRNQNALRLGAIKNKILTERKNIAEREWLLEQV